MPSYFTPKVKESLFVFFFSQPGILIPRLGMEPAYLTLLSVESEQLGHQGSPDSGCLLWWEVCSSWADLGNHVYNGGISWCKERPKALLRTRIQSHFPRFIQSHPRECRFRRRSPGQHCPVDKKEGSRTPGGTGPGVFRRHPAAWQWVSLRPVTTGRDIHPSSLRQMTMFAPQSCLTLCGPMDCSPPDSSVHESS